MQQQEQLTRHNCHIRKETLLQKSTPKNIFLFNNKKGAMSQFHNSGTSHGEDRATEPEPEREREREGRRNNWRKKAKWNAWEYGTHFLSHGSTYTIKHGQELIIQKLQLIFLNFIFS